MWIQSIVAAHGDPTKSIDTYGDVPIAPPDDDPLAGIENLSKLSKQELSKLVTSLVSSTATTELTITSNGTLRFVGLCGH